MSGVRRFLRLPIAPDPSLIHSGQLKVRQVACSFHNFHAAIVSPVRGAVIVINGCCEDQLRDAEAVLRIHFGVPAPPN